MDLAFARMTHAGRAARLPAFAAMTSKVGVHNPCEIGV
jgi:hypothetical protein